MLSYLWAARGAVARSPSASPIPSESTERERRARAGSGILVRVVSGALRPPRRLLGPIRLLEPRLHPAQTAARRGELRLGRPARSDLLSAAAERRQVGRDNPSYLTAAGRRIDIVPLRRQRHGGVAKLVYRAGLSSRRSRVQAPSLPLIPSSLAGFFFGL